MVKKELNKTIVSFDIEGSGQNPIKNPTLQIAAVVMSMVVTYVNGKFGSVGFEVHDAFCTCLRMNTKEIRDKKINELIMKYSSEIAMITKTNRMKKIQKKCRGLVSRFDKEISSVEEFEPGCLKWWKSDKEREEILNDILKLAVSKKDGYTQLHAFLTKNWKSYPEMKVISDNSPYDLARIDLEMQTRGKKNGFMWFNSEFGKRDNGYKGFGMDSNDFAKGFCTARNMDTDESIKPKDLYEELKVDDMFNKLLKKIPNDLVDKYKMKPHSALYDALKIGTEHLMLCSYHFNRQRKKENKKKMMNVY